MSETDDRIVGDLVWELFPGQPNGASRAGVSLARVQNGLAALALASGAWVLHPALGVAVICLGVSARDYRTGWRLARSIPDKAGGRVCSRSKSAVVPRMISPS